MNNIKKFFNLYLCYVFSHPIRFIISFMFWEILLIFIFNLFY